MSVTDAFNICCFSSNLFNQCIKLIPIRSSNFQPYSTRNRIMKTSTVYRCFMSQLTKSKTPFFPPMLISKTHLKSHQLKWIEISELTIEFSFLCNFLCLNLVPKNNCLFFFLEHQVNGRFFSFFYKDFCTWFEVYSIENLSFFLSLFFFFNFQE